MMVSSSRSRMRSMRGGSQGPGTPVRRTGVGRRPPCLDRAHRCPTTGARHLLVAEAFWFRSECVPSDGKLWTEPACRARGVQRAILPRPCGQVARISPMRVACLNRARAAIRMPAPTRTPWTDNLMASVRKAFDWSTVLITVCMLTAAVVVYLRDGQERFAAVCFNDVEIFLDILPKMT